MRAIKQRVDSNWFQLPTLMDMPTKQSVTYGIFFSVLTGFVVVFMYMVGADKYPSFFFGALLICMSIHALLSYYWFHGNILIYFRYFLLFLPVFITVLAWWVWNGAVLTGPFGAEFQTLSSTSLLVTCGFLSLMGCTSGWLAAFQQPALPRGSLKESIIQQKRVLLWIGVSLTVIFGLLYVVQTGGMLSADRVYAANDSDGQELGFEFGVFNIFQQLGISFLILVAAVSIESRQRLYIVIAISLFMGIMAGSRADYLPSFMIISLYFWALRTQHPKSKPTNERVKQTKRLFLFVLLGIVGFLAASGVAAWRSFPSLSVVDVTKVIIEKGPELLVNDLYGHRMLYIETGNMAIGGMYGLIENVRRDGFLLGETYFDYLLRTPPAFLGINRPEDLAYRTGIGGTMMSQGGTFEPAEAYANFGLIGCFVIPLILSYIMGVLLKKANRNGSVFFASWYLVYGLMSFREIWYQTFGYFRLATIFLVLYVVLLLLRPSLLGRKSYSIFSN